MSTIKENLFGSKTLIGNWYEDRSNPTNNNHNFYAERKTQDNLYQPVLTKTEFTSTHGNWLLNNPKDDTFRTTYQNEFKKPVDQTRTSKLNNFLLKKDVFEKDAKALEEYRQKYTKAPQIFPRSYAGAI